MIVLIAKTIFFFALILIVSAIVFTLLARFIGKFFNVTIAQDSVIAPIIKKISRY